VDSFAPEALALAVIIGAAAGVIRGITGFGGLLLGVRLFRYFSQTRFRQFALLLLIAVSTGILLA